MLRPQVVGFLAYLIESPFLNRCAVSLYQFLPARDHRAGAFDMPDSDKLCEVNPCFLAHVHIEPLRFVALQVRPQSECVRGARDFIDPERVEACNACDDEADRITWG
jgi:hypothetical protein